MTTFLPLFPLELVAFPEEELRLHIFEPRYKELFGECETQNTNFGITAYISGKLAEYGTGMELIEVYNRYPGGEMDVITRGLRVFHLEQFHRNVPERQYSGGDVTFIENDPESFNITRDELIQKYHEFHQLIGTEKPREDFRAQNLSFAIGHEVGLTLIQKVELLSEPREAERQLRLIKHLHEIIPAIQAAEESRRRIKRNGHFHKPMELEF